MTQKNGPRYEERPFEKTRESATRINSKEQFQRKLKSKSEIITKIKAYEAALRARHHELEIERKVALKKLASELFQASKALAQLIHAEVRKPLPEALAEINKSAAALDYFADWVGFRAQALKAMEPGEFELRAEPLGFILAIMPWNFPIWQFVRIFAPQVRIGNGVLWKPSLITPKTAQAFMDLIDDVGLGGYCDLLFVPNDQVGEWIECRHIKGVSFTGSTKAGRTVAAQAGQALKKVVLELGGSDPFIVCESADLDQAVAAALKARTQNWGQSCIAAKRFIICRKHYEPFKEKFLSLASKLEPRALVSPEAARLGQEQIKSFQALGGRFFGVEKHIAVCSETHFPVGLIEIQAQQLEQMPELARLYSEEELFCPVGLLTAFRSADEALALANSTCFGLGASLWTNDPEEKELFKGQLKCGHLAINDFTRSDPAIPFGGLGWSGFGKELGELGLREFCHFKVIKLG
jgi:succinate-semialdehyde dehydrogenase/glutarate-semialdehyde dehydrogenase